MITFTIVIHKPYKKITKHLKENAKIIKETIYDTLTQYGINEETAIDCSGWCELASVGESYSTDDFDVYLEEETA